MLLPTEDGGARLLLWGGLYWGPLVEMADTHGSKELKEFGSTDPDAIAAACRANIAMSAVFELNLDRSVLEEHSNQAVAN